MLGRGWRTAKVGNNGASHTQRTVSRLPTGAPDRGLADYGGYSEPQLPRARVPNSRDDPTTGNSLAPKCL